MNRPSVLRNLETHVAQGRVTGYRVRPPEVAKLIEYVRHLEGRTKVRPDRAVVPDCPTDEHREPMAAECAAPGKCMCPAHSAKCRYVENETPPFVHRADCAGEHEGEICPVEMTRRTRSA